MAKKKGISADTETQLDMTPIIDIVFNLVIFFMVITDMTQQDLEFLALPKAPMAVEDKGEDKERLIINIIDFAHPDNKHRVERGEISTQKPPIFVDGRQVDSLDHMRQWLRLRADPTRYPDMDKPVIDPSTGLRPSKKPVLIRCDQAQVFGWVQAIMQYCTFVPGNKQSDELQKSPMIYKLEIAVGTNKKQGEQ